MPEAPNLKSAIIVSGYLHVSATSCGAEIRRTYRVRREKKFHAKVGKVRWHNGGNQRKPWT